MLACFHQADNAHNQPCDGADNRDNEKPAENSAHNAEYERAYREIILFMLQLVNDYRSLGIDLWLLAIVCSLIGRGAPAGRRNSGPGKEFPGGIHSADRDSVGSVGKDSADKDSAGIPGYHYCWYYCNYPFNYSCLFKVI